MVTNAVTTQAERVAGNKSETPCSRRGLVDSVILRPPKGGCYFFVPLVALSFLGFLTSLRLLLLPFPMFVSFALQWAWLIPKPAHHGRLWGNSTRRARFMSIFDSGLARFYSPGPPTCSASTLARA